MALVVPRVTLMFVKGANSIEIEGFITGEKALSIHDITIVGTVPPHSFKLGEEYPLSDIVTFFVVTNLFDETNSKIIYGDGSTGTITDFCTLANRFGVAITQTTPGDHDGSTPFEITITFDAAIQPATFTAADLTVAITEGTVPTIDNLATADDIVFTADVTPTGVGDITISLAEGAVLDALGLRVVEAAADLTVAYSAE